MNKKLVAVGISIGLALLVGTSGALAEKIHLNDPSAIVSDNLAFELKPEGVKVTSFQFDSERRVNLGIVQHADNVAVTEWKIYDKDKKVVYSQELNANSNAIYTESKILPAGIYTMEVVNKHNQDITGNAHIYFNHINDPKDTVSPNLDLNKDGGNGQTFYFQIDTPRMVSVGAVQEGKDVAQETVWYISNEKGEGVYEEKLNTTGEPVYTTPKLLQPGMYEVNIVNGSDQEMMGNAYIYYTHP